MGNTINIPFENMLCHHALCMEDYYELDWFSKKTWDIELHQETNKIDNKKNNKKDNKGESPIHISKGKVQLKNINNVSILFHREINIYEEEISNLLIPYNYLFNCKSKFDVYILINNDLLSLHNIRNYISKLNNNQDSFEQSYLFHFHFENNLLQLQNNKVNDKINNELNNIHLHIPILCNFINRNLLNITTTFYNITASNNNLNEENKSVNNLVNNTLANKLYLEEKNILMEDLTNVHFYFYLQVQQLENNEFISFYLS